MNVTPTDIIKKTPSDGSAHAHTTATIAARAAYDAAYAAETHTAAHTPPPWHVGCAGLSADGRVRNLSLSADAPFGDAVADKRLIEAATELLAASQAVVDRWETPLWKDVPHTGEFIGRLREAIAKANGGTQ